MVTAVLFPQAVVDPLREACPRRESSALVEWDGDVEGSMVERCHKDVVA